MSLSNIRTYENISGKYEEVSYETIYREFFTVDDLFLFFRKYKERVASSMMLPNKKNNKDKWNFLLCSSICGTMRGDERYICMGCTLLKRFNPSFSSDKKGSIKNGIFSLKSGLLVGENFEIKRAPLSEENIIKNLLLVDTFLPSHNNLLFFYICNNEFVYCTRQYDYGNGTFDILINNNFTSFDSSSSTNRLLYGEIIEAILHQVENYLRVLELYNLHLHNLSLNNLAFSSEIYNEGDESFSITVYLILDDESNVVNDGEKYSIEREMEILITNLKKDKIFLRSLNLQQ